MLKSAQYVLFLLLLLSCTKDRSGYTKADIEQLAKEAAPPQLPLAVRDKKAPDPAEKEAILQFSEFYVRLIDYAYLAEPAASGDTIQVRTEVGQDLDSKLLQIIPNNDSDRFKVFVAIEQSLTVSLGERQTKDLKDWKHLYSYVELSDSADNHFRTIPFQREEKEARLSFDFLKIKDKVLQHEGEYITTNLDSVTRVQGLPIELWISRVIIRIEQTRMNGTKINHYIDAISPYGC